MQINLLLFSQTNRLVKGVVIDEETEEPLSYASISLKNLPVGTISNEKGEFNFFISKYKDFDTIVISYIGYKHSLIYLNSVDTTVKIQLKREPVALNEVVISPLSPEDYIIKALYSIKDNYSFSPFQSISYYKEELLENNNLIIDDESVFKTYYPKHQDSITNTHQLLLYRKSDEVQEFTFMRDWFEKKEEKEKRKAEKSGENIEKYENNENSIMDFGGPETILYYDILNNLPHFIDTNNFKYYNYSFGNHTSYKGKSVLSINFESKRKVDHIIVNGTIFIDLESYAFISLENTGEIFIPNYIRSFLLMFGLKINNPTYNKVIKYQQYNGIWYPKDFHWDLNVKLAKQYLFKSNETSIIDLSQLLIVNEIKLNDIYPIEKEKIFKPDKKMEDQVFNDEKIIWEKINILKN